MPSTTWLGLTREQRRALTPRKTPTEINETLGGARMLIRQNISVDTFNAIVGTMYSDYELRTILGYAAMLEGATLDGEWVERNVIAPSRGREVQDGSL